MSPDVKLGTVEASEQLIRDLYIDLKKKVNFWASKTNQTAQARMGYVGQHLVSVVTGYKGGKSGARGYDLVLPDHEYAEIKTCYRIDQLGKCNDCGAVVAGIEDSCTECGSENIQRKDDSKWLITIRNDEEFKKIIEPKYYYLVLFEFVDLSKPDVIQMSIFQVDPKRPGFAYCMIDYYLNIRAGSESKAPFNFWPYQLKFYLMNPSIIYQSIVTSDDKIETKIWPDKPVSIPLQNLREYSRSTNLKITCLANFAESIGKKVDFRLSKRAMLEEIQEYIEKNRMDPVFIADNLAKAMYLPNIEKYMRNLPNELVNKIYD